MAEFTPPNELRLERARVAAQMRRAEDAETERNAALAVIEKVREALKWGSIPQGMTLTMLLETVITNATRELASVDRSVLAERDAETRRKVIEDMVRAWEKSWPSLPGGADWLRALAEGGESR